MFFGLKGFLKKLCDLNSKSAQECVLERIRASVLVERLIHSSNTNLLHFLSWAEYPPFKHLLYFTCLSPIRGSDND
jgi:hypothetical protein